MELLAGIKTYFLEMVGAGMLLLSGLTLFRSIGQGAWNPASLMLSFLSIFIGFLLLTNKNLGERLREGPKEHMQ